MEFNSHQAIYLQIADLVCENILRGVWKPKERIPSIRDLAVQISVNPNTVVKTYNYLESQGIIENQRGIGFFVATDGYEQVLRLKRGSFFSQESEYFFRQMDLLHVSWDELRALYEEYRRKHTDI